MSPPDPPFLERRVYRRRRLRDAARLLPILGAVLFALPVMWTGPAGASDASTARGGVYVFAAWAALIVAAALLSRGLGRDGTGPGGD